MKKLISIMLLSFCLSTYAQQDGAELTSSCVACHGAQGVSNNDVWPNLAAQQVDYLVKELLAFRDGERKDPLMAAAYLKEYSDQQLKQIALYYSELPAATPVEGEPPIASQHVRGYCISCHGLNGNTVTSIWPNLAGQKAGYLQKQLLDYKSGKRKHPMMQVIASELTEQQIADVAEYFQFQ